MGTRQGGCAVRGGRVCGNEARERIAGAARHTCRGPSSSGNSVAVIAQSLDASFFGTNRLGGIAYSGSLTRASKLSFPADSRRWVTFDSVNVNGSVIMHSPKTAAQ